ncbi:caspase recruitment domain-containing protein 14 [Danio rerio]|uniref:Caspase recruitment domain-containing protein 14 n=1 Tax=Danio rerio TaxID=7955 RepID=A0A8M9Q0C3_DANRE|nr:caspase recruitment domain-containing protein 14 [Danio rerio]XP_021332748.1 caspase recruitment domain-containing protein 14 [Danio rerio]|eukprot:XP_021329758.1 caspase recruitment domain-containing protein 14 [Danio rerio]
MAESVLDTPDLKDLQEEELWGLINDNRHAICLGIRPCVLIPYLRQARVLTDLDEDEILNCLTLINRSMRTSHMLDLLRIQGRNGAMALLESLMIHYPTLYTQITGRQPSIEPSRFSGLIKYTELTEYLVHAVSSMQKELQVTQHESSRLRAQCCELEGKLGQAEQNNQEFFQIQREHARLHNHLDGLNRELLKLKDEKCDLYVRYTTALEEKSANVIRNRDLQLEIYQLQCDLRKAQKQTEFQRQHSVKNLSDTQKLKDELSAVRAKLLETETFSPVKQDILAHDLKEIETRRSELAEEVNRINEEKEQLQQEKEELLEEKNSLALEVAKLTVDCEMYKHRSMLFQSQLEDVQAERDKAYLSRDEAQAQIARSLAEKDTLRSQLMELQEKLFTMNACSTQRERREKSRDRKFSCESSPPSSPTLRRQRCDLKTIHPKCFISYDASEFSDEHISSIISNQVEPPCSESLRRRDLHFSSRSDTEDNFSIQDLADDCFTDDDYVVIAKGHCLEESVSSSSISSPMSKRSHPDSVSRVSAPPFLMRSRPQALRITGRILTIFFQGETLLNQIQIIGGNKTGVFVHHVTKESSAHNSGISPGTQILQLKYERKRRAVQMVLEDTTMEEALWALGQVQGPCHITLRPNQDAYENLLQQLKNDEVMSGDSFYVRVNMTLPGDVAGNLSVKCNDIIHITNTYHTNDGFWWGSHVHPCHLEDLKSGALPNYYRAQRLLIRAIEDMTYSRKTHRKGRTAADEKQRVVRIVSTSQQRRNPLWVSVEDDNSKSQDNDGCLPSRCLTLMPFTLVTPRFPPICRPVLLLPTILGRVLHKRLAEQEGYQLCEPEQLMTSEHGMQMQKGEILEECDSKTHLCYTLQGVEKIMKRGTHCVLPFGLDCVCRLHRAEIFPIIVYIISTERSLRRLRHKLRQNSVTESQVLECSCSEEPLLDKLPCLYRSIPPESWHDTATLVDTLKTVVTEEQNKIVWVESDPW